MKTTFKFNWKTYWSPTPKKIRQWADALLITFWGGGMGTFHSNPEISKLLFAIGLVLKLISNLFKDEENSDFTNIDFPNKLQ